MVMGISMSWNVRCDAMRCNVLAIMVALTYCTTTVLTIGSVLVCMVFVIEG